MENCFSKRISQAENEKGAVNWNDYKNNTLLQTEAQGMWRVWSETFLF